MDAKGEVMLTIMSSLAQEESRSISENVTWGKRRSMEEGKFSLAYKRFLGYEKGEDGLPKIVEEEAKIVREIYDRFLEGDTVRTIADNLTSRGIPTPAGKEKWSVSTIMSILQNEKYKGDALLQKTYAVDFLSKTIKKMRARFPSTISKTRIRPSLIPIPLSWYRMRSNDGDPTGGICTGAVRLRGKSFVVIVTAFTAKRCGTAEASIAAISGDATKNTRTRFAVLPRIYGKLISKMHLL